MRRGWRLLNHMFSNPQQYSLGSKQATNYLGNTTYWTVACCEEKPFQILL